MLGIGYLQAIFSKEAQTASGGDTWPAIADSAEHRSRGNSAVSAVKRFLKLLLHSRLRNLLLNRLR
jgi:hypothetical protein